MESELPLGQPGRDKLVQQLLAQSGAPAFVNRDAKVRTAWRKLVASAREEWEKRSLMPRLLTGRLKALSDQWTNLPDRLRVAKNVAVLEALDALLKPELRSPPGPTRSELLLWTTARELNEAIERFNAYWSRFVQDVDFTEVNRERDKYNRYYVLEKECLLGSAILARRGFRPLPMADAEELLQELPLLPLVPAVQ